VIYACGILYLVDSGLTRGGIDRGFLPRGAGEAPKLLARDPDENGTN